MGGFCVNGLFCSNGPRLGGGDRRRLDLRLVVPSGRLCCGRFFPARLRLL